MALKERITLQEIAGMVGVSRNTVSKIVNGRYTGSDQIRNRVVTILRENNYKGFGETEEEDGDQNRIKTILLLCSGETAQSDFFLPFVSRIQQNVESRGYVLVFYGLMETELDNRQLPQMVLDGKVDGVICIEVSRRPYIEELLACRIPVAFLDFCYGLWDVPGRYDVVLANSEHPFYVMTSQLLKRGCQKIGFVGEIFRSRGTYERYCGYSAAMAWRGLPAENDFCIDTTGLGDARLEERIGRKLDAFSVTPDAFVIANDGIAMVMLKLLKERKVRVPLDVQLISFGNTKEGALVEPSLTTVGSDREEMAEKMVGCLFQRMDDPEKRRSVVYVDSRILYRDSSLIGM